MSNIRGKAYAMNVLTPMKRWKTPILKAAFRFFSMRWTQWELRALSFIHFARWTAIAPAQWPVFPGMTRQPRLKRDYLLFESNFNGSWNEYVDAFHSVLSLKLNLVWWWSDKYPGSIPLTSFKRYIEHNQFHTDYYYMAYPGASVTDVKNALTVQNACDRLVSRADDTDGGFDAAWNAFLHSVQNCLAPTGGRGPRMT